MTAISQTRIPQTSVASAFPTLRRGDRGRDIQVVQTRLNQLGFTLDLDGIFGVCTEGAVKTFQQRRSLSINGVVGLTTWKALIPPTLQRGSAGPDVEYLQTTLQAIGYTLSADRIFGARTQWGVEKFQTERGLTVNGSADPLTWKALLSHRVAIGV
ncbi:peptidoglycan-binding protein [Oscillatoriales cyanobacterium LEGE 11467]|uniref:Peptidoglycan-binding protein n=1 Tax=Zarconia navalis LEGE 11467 TaxID=1828826 RepID=A0A928VZM3_9CYAN|nr:peptidoglycan-binding protein [Zarconia navalis]MBE9040590.1 peptidoglycan-binding protein [Zarconia navalis LEGE 11467]